jgi:hypothetical protein
MVEATHTGPGAEKPGHVPMGDPLDSSGTAALDPARQAAQPGPAFGIQRDASVDSFQSQDDLPQPEATGSPITGQKCRCVSVYARLMLGGGELSLRFNHI